MKTAVLGAASMIGRRITLEAVVPRRAASLATHYKAGIPQNGNPL